MVAEVGVRARVHRSRRTDGDGTPPRLRAGRGTSPQISALPGVPSFLALNDANNFVFLVLGGVLLLGALVIPRTSWVDESDGSCTPADTGDFCS